MKHDVEKRTHCDVLREIEQQPARKLALSTVSTSIRIAHSNHRLVLDVKCPLTVIRRRKRNLPTSSVRNPDTEFHERLTIDAHPSLDAPRLWPILGRCSEAVAGLAACSDGSLFIL